VLSRGLLSGHWSRDRELRPNDFRSRSPFFARENIDHNLALADALGAIASDKGVTTAQVAIAWVLGRGDDIVPLVGARRRDRLHEALGALEVELTEDDLDRIEAAIPAGAAAGTRYDDAQMAMLDSER
jgi:aryl-alcohol dehydrogenase-like predicted oxidoreductase